MTRTELEKTAGVVQRLAVLLAAGVAPASAWGYVDEEVAAVAIRGEPIAPVLAERSDAWRGLAAAWQVAIDAGAPLAPALRTFAVSLRALAHASRETDTALAGPVATARMVMVLPAVGVLFGMVLGFNTLATLFTTLPGLVCLVAGCALLLIAHRWNRRLVARARPRDLTPGIRFELLAIALGGGVSIERARTSVDVALAMAGLLVDENREVDAVLDLSRRAGVPAAELLRAEAEESRREASARALESASVLAVRLMLPLGLCILPAFMLVGVAPLLLAVISSTVSTF
jgi:tight adherence protein B